MDQTEKWAEMKNVYTVKAGIRNQNINKLFSVAHIKSNHCQKMFQLGTKLVRHVF